ncbi:MAG: cation:proton antiporter [Victivallales bacterium]|nr:cation:proton antiporter [Victivallales bacterium]
MTLVQDLAAVMLAAGLVAALFHYLGWPKVIGYIAAGALMGLPQIKPFLIGNPSIVSELANLGVIFLMFTMGLDLNIRRLRKLGGVVFPSAAVDLALMLLVGYALGRSVFRWGPVPSVFLGAMLCDSSTTLLAKSLEEMGCAKSHFASVIFGVTLSEDIITIGLLAILTGLGMTGQFQASELASRLVKLLLFLVGVMGFGLLILPKFLNRLCRLRDDETLLIIVLGICFGLSFVADNLQFSLALGAFLVGAVTSESKVARRLREHTDSLRSVFSAIFFVSIGLMVDLPQMWQNLGAILLVSLLVIVGKTLNNTLAAFALGQPRREAFQIGVGLAQIGDFSYMVALLGMSLNDGCAPYPQMYQIAVGASVLTTVLNPPLLKGGATVAQKVSGWSPSRLETMLSGYTNWASRTGHGIRRGGGLKACMRPLAFLLLYTMLIAVVFLVAEWLQGRKALWQLLPDWLKALDVQLLWLSSMLVSLPLIFGFFLSARQLGEGVSNSSVPSFVSGRMGGAMRRMTMMLVTGLCMLVLCVQVTSLSLLLFRDWSVMVFAVIIYAVIILLSWRKIRSLATESQETLALVWDREENEANDIQNEVCQVPDASCVAGRTLAELRLRNRTGASVTLIEPLDGGSVLPPGPEDRLFVGDRLHVTGTAAQLAALRQLLASPTLPAFPALESLDGMLNLQVAELPLDAHSPALGNSLRELNLRSKSGVTVVRIISREKGVFTDNPLPDQKLAPGDVLCVIGNDRQLADARKLVSPTKEAKDGE